VTLKLRNERAVLFAEIDAPPMNLLGPELVRDLVSLIPRAEADDSVRVLVFKSADPDYFISHVDVMRIREYREEAAKLTGEASIALLFRHLNASRLVSIAQIEGRVRAAGSEFALACDMRFAARETAMFSQMEPAFGLIPGGGGAQHLARLMGRGRALEVMLGAEDYGAVLAPTEDFRRDSQLSGDGVREPGVQGRIQAAMARGFQTREAELALARLLAELD
jgi:enoyl-CoA hydratase/carnithine racemase